MTQPINTLLSYPLLPQLPGIVDLLPWKLDMISQKEIRTEGLFAALNDCLYRNMKTVQYLIMMDLDELIIPYQVAAKQLKRNGLMELLVVLTHFSVNQS